MLIINGIRRSSGSRAIVKTALRRQYRVRCHASQPPSPRCTSYAGWSGAASSCHVWLSGSHRWDNRTVVGRYGSARGQTVGSCRREVNIFCLSINQPDACPTIPHSVWTGNNVRMCVCNLPMLVYVRKHHHRLLHLLCLTHGSASSVPLSGVDIVCSSLRGRYPLFLFQGSISFVPLSGVDILCPSFRG